MRRPTYVPYGMDADDLPDAEELTWIAEETRAEVEAARKIPKQRETRDDD